MMRWAPFCPIPGTRVSVLTSSVAIARRRSSGLSTASIAWASLGPTPDAVWTSSKTCFSSSSRKPKSVSESSRTTMLVGSVAGLADAQRGEGAGRAHQLEADAADLEDGAGQGDGGDLAADEGDHRVLIGVCFCGAGLARPGRGGLDAGVGASRARRG